MLAALERMVMVYLAVSGSDAMALAMASAEMPPLRNTVRVFACDKSVINGGWWV